MVALVTTTGFYVLKYNRDAVEAAFESGAAIDEDGVEEAFEVINQVSVRCLYTPGVCARCAWRILCCTAECAGLRMSQQHARSTMRLLAC
jgi:hypothetical protein